MSGRVLVTGGAGFIGSHLVDVLVARGERVTVLDDFSVGLQENLYDAERQGDVRVLTGSIMNADAVEAALSGVDRVYHMAVQCVRRSLGRPRESHDVNATGTLVVLAEALRKRVRSFVYCSSSEVYGNASSDRLIEDKTVCRPVTVYGSAKLAGELYTHAYRQTYGLPALVVRPFNAYGPRAYQTGERAEVIPRFVGRVLNGLPPVVFGDGSSGRDFTFVTETAEAIRRCGETEGLVGETINLAYGRMITVHEVALMVLQALGRNDLEIASMQARPGDVRHLHADTGKARRLTGWQASISFETGLKRYIEWVRARFPETRALLDAEVVNWKLPLDVRT